MADPQTIDNLTVRQHKALSALMSEPSVSQAALACEVPERTLRNWLRLDVFAEAYRIARRESTQQAIAQGQQHSGAMMRRLVWLAEHARSEAVQRAAARDVLDISFKWVELEDLAERLAALEQAYATKS